MEKTCTERNEKTFYLYMIPEGDCKVKPYDLMQNQFFKSLRLDSHHKYGGL